MSEQNAFSNQPIFQIMITPNLPNCGRSPLVSTRTIDRAIREIKFAVPAALPVYPVVARAANGDGADACRLVGRISVILRSWPGELFRSSGSVRRTGSAYRDNLPNAPQHPAFSGALTPACSREMRDAHSDTFRGRKVTRVEYTYALAESILSYRSRRARKNSTSSRR